MVVMDLKEKKPLNEFLMTIRYFPVALSLFVKVKENTF